LKEQELEGVQRRVQAEEKDQNFLERKEKTRIHRELETLERNYSDIQNQHKIEMQQKQHEINSLQKHV